MLLHQLIIPTFLFPFAVISQSATYIVGANQALTDQTRSVIDTVDQERVIEDVTNHHSLARPPTHPAPNTLLTNREISASPQRSTEPRGANQQHDTPL